MVQWLLSWLLHKWKGRLSVTNLSLENDFASISAECSSRHQSESERNANFQSSISIEVLLWGYHLDVQGLLHQQLLLSAMVQYGGLLPVDRVVVLPCVLRYSLLICRPLTGISVFLQSRLQSRFGLPDVDLTLVNAKWDKWKTTIILL